MLDPDGRKVGSSREPWQKPGPLLRVEIKALQYVTHCIEAFEG